MDCECPLYNVSLPQSELRLPLLQVVSNNKSFSVGVQSPTEINAPRGCAVILRRICQLSLTRITHQVSRAFDLNRWLSEVRSTESSCEKNTYIVKYIRNAQETYSNFLYEGKSEEG